MFDFEGFYLSDLLRLRGPQAGLAGAGASDWTLPMPSNEAPSVLPALSGPLRQGESLWSPFLPPSLPLQEPLLGTLAALAGPPHPLCTSSPVGGA